MKMLGTKSVWYLTRGSIIDSSWHSIGSLVQVSVRDIVYDLVWDSIKESINENA